MPIILINPSPANITLPQKANKQRISLSQITAAMEPYLLACNIDYRFEDPDFVIDTPIIKNYNLQLILQSQSAPANLSGQIQGIDVYFSPGNQASKNAATIIAKNLEVIYPHPQLVGTVPDNHLPVINSVYARVIAHLAYHDNQEDIDWLYLHSETIAANLVLSLTKIFDLNFRFPH